ncbi:type II-A CRISPR-associated protein Csn2 [Ruminococcus flavefaciens]|uniref:CRISPR type II-A-associated protein Csn2 n=1 Tax=Ruminococcus flavefaciens TaxID=1265 RepID=A0A315YIU3_RUMFL|nr:type II-A CRISPR-associated protein Csn2 [Ruminococcus flavefaciens]PWJ11203.1 CRISPR type II-A-associated protein Csn2 [Ruminococcus flavefaciens]SSA50765.1 CRISPR-associated protein (Cas_Csn2) [Ruminococcus flavefaciens]
MMIAYPAADICCEISEDRVRTIVIENQHMFYSVVSDICSQLEGNNGEIVISEEHTPLDMRKSADLITQFVPFTVNQKELITKLYAALKKKAVDEKMYQYTQEIYRAIGEYLYQLIEDEENELDITIPEDITGILKAFDVRFDDSELTLQEKLLEYMLSASELRGHRLFITVNLRSYLTDRETEEFFRSLLLKKIRLMCIESADHPRLINEEVIIIDKDMCVI